MPRATKTLHALNRGIISRLGLARVDLDRTNMSAEVMTNWMPRLLGSMQLRCGTQYIGASESNAKAKYLPFIFSQSDTAHIEFANSLMRVRISDVLISRTAVTAVTTNGNFDANLTNWTDNDEGSAASTWVTGGYMGLLGTGTDAAIRDQAVVIVEANTEHALRIVVTRGPVILRVGSAATLDDYISETTLGTGTHSLAFTPTTGSFYIRVMNRRSFSALIDSINVEAAGTMTLPIPYASTDFDSIRRTPSGDVIYLACSGFQQRKIERRTARSWSIVLYEPEDGPFRALNATPITLAPSALTGDITLTASKAFFKSTNVGSLFRIQSAGQNVTVSVSVENTFSNPILVTGTGAARAIGVIVTGTFVGTVTLQYSVGAPGSWVDTAPVYTVPTSTTYNDGLDNQDIYYRIGIKTGGYTSGTAVCLLSFTAGSITGIARATAFTSSLIMNAVVLSDFGATTASDDWWEGAWSDRRGWPSGVAIFESRMSFGGFGKVYGSISDEYESFDDTVEGDSGLIARSIGEGPLERIPWLLPLNQLIVGIESVCANVEALKIQGNTPLAGRSSSFDEPLTPTNFNLKSTGATGMFVDGSGTRLMELAYNITANGYEPDDLTVAVPDLNDEIVQIAVQYKPDLRVHCRRSDGTVGVMIRDRAENLICWVEVETSGIVEDISVMPGTVEDRVYYSVQRTINGATVRYLEKFALESETRGQPEAYLADAHLRFSGAATTTITGLSHLEGEEVVVWGWNTTTPFLDDQVNEVGRDFGTFTVSGGQITGLSDAVTNACVGLAYTAQWKSCKLAFAAQMGTALNVSGKVHHIGLILADFHAQGLQYGPSFEDLDDMPLTEDDEEVDEDRVWADYDEPFFEFDGDWDTDSRICLQAASPRPCTVLAVSIDMTKSG